MIIKVLLILTLSMLCPRLSGKVDTKWVVAENSSLRVNGSTNVNRFSCAIINYPKTDTVTINQENGKQMALNGRVSLDLKNFDCNNLLMTKQLRKTLKEDKFPFLHITFISLKGIPLSNQTNNMIRGLVEIEIAGVKKRFLISYQLKNRMNGMALIGSQPINFSDFKLAPPQKMGKIIQAKDQLSVTFELNLQQAR
jgi:hypothetical protein